MGLFPEKYSLCETSPELHDGHSFQLNRKLRLPQHTSTPASTDQVISARPALKDSASPTLLEKILQAFLVGEPRMWPFGGANMLLSSVCPTMGRFNMPCVVGQ